MQPLFTTGDVVLFQGDSITDWGRDREDPTHLGSGYALMAAAWFQALYPELEVQFINRGIGGNRVVDLEARWQQDCLDLHPGWVSLLIGINDTWRRYDNADPTSTQRYEDGYRRLLDRTVQATQARLILCEPFVLPYPAGREVWREDLDPKIAVVRKIAREYNAIYVPFDGIFAQVATQRAPEFWAADGVHPTPAGHALMAQAWLRAVKALA
ncbi:SGNH/GDSL hydrolase family protein [Dictyobacter arantiisoli]|uniref:Lipase n=1 Tax=Dictyobacter arantiisoli TaxID=2014874 RepID=A0A5A5T8D2_9CHLR|nr:SGNH/GDSL hydrolase family protein [Dictyobacter arantiisoli]GCF07668.1 lipase [Dictyobacter arantiisoli]